MLAAGDIIGPETLVITREQIVRYAGASGDYNPIHYDDERARSFGLPGVIVHGMLNMGVIARIIKSHAPRQAHFERYGVRFRKMVQPGQKVVVSGTVQSVHREHGQTRVAMDVLMALEGETSAITGQAILTWPDEP